MALIAGALALSACKPTGTGGTGGKSPRAPSPIAAMAKRSDAVVVGRVLRARARWEGKLIVTTVEVEPVEWYKGRSRDRTLRVSYLGGTVGVITQAVSHEPTFEVGEVSVMFLSPVATSKPGAGTLRVVDEAGRIPVLVPGQRVERLDNNVRLRRELDAIQAEVKGA